MMIKKIQILAWILLLAVQISVAHAGPAALKCTKLLVKLPFDESEPFLAFKTTALMKGFSNRFIEKIANQRPDILEKIAAEPCEPVIMYRGLKLSHIEQYDPSFQSVQFADPWCTNHLDYATVYASGGGPSDAPGIVIQFEIPSFMFTVKVPVGEITDRKYFAATLSHQLIAGDEAPFITRIAILKHPPSFVPWSQVVEDMKHKKYQPPRKPLSQTQSTEQFEKLLDHWVDH